jgi:hypothetical protein
MFTVQCDFTYEDWTVSLFFQHVHILDAPIDHFNKILFVKSVKNLSSLTWPKSLLPGHRIALLV